MKFMDELDEAIWKRLRGDDFRWNNFHGIMPGGFLRRMYEDTALSSNPLPNVELAAMIRDVDKTIVEFCGEGSGAKRFLERYFDVYDKSSAAVKYVFRRMNELSGMREKLDGTEEYESKKRSALEDIENAERNASPYWKEMDGMLEPIIFRMMAKGYSFYDLLG
jgi:hypothetical protein